MRNLRTKSPQGALSACRSRFVTCAQMSLGKELRNFLGDPQLKLSYKATASRAALIATGLVFCKLAGSCMRVTAIVHGAQLCHITVP